MRRRIAFARINTAALARAEDVLRQWLPDGAIAGREYVARNPRRVDRRPGSFKINLDTGRWGDWAAGVFGGDLVSLAAYLGDLRQADAARGVAEMLGIDAYE